MENALFYTFSTIAQTLAGAIALLGAFVLYRLQILYQELDSHTEIIPEFYKDNEAPIFINRYIINRQYENLLEFIENNPDGGQTDEQSDFLKTTENRIRDLIAMRKRFLLHFKWTLIGTLLVIATAVILIALTPKISSSGYCTPSLVFGIGCFLACLVSYGFLLLGTFKSISPNIHCCEAHQLQRARKTNCQASVKPPEG